jgi:hypothetical protein
MDIGIEPLQLNQRRCPVCQKTITHTLAGNCKRAHRKNQPCRSCANSFSQGGTGDCFPSAGLRRCASCNEAKPLDDFMWVATKKRYYSHCNPCRLAKLRSYGKNVNRFRKLGIDFSIDQLNEMLDVQKGKCLICERTMGEPCVDHCHTTGNVRGLLCRGCNAAIGSLGDSPELLERAVKYLRGEL